MNYLILLEKITYTKNLYNINDAYELNICSVDTMLKYPFS